MNKETILLWVRRIVCIAVIVLGILVIATGISHSNVMKSISGICLILLGALYFKPVKE